MAAATSSHEDRLDALDRASAHLAVVAADLRRRMTQSAPAAVLDPIFALPLARRARRSSTRRTPAPADPGERCVARARYEWQPHGLYYPAPAQHWEVRCTLGADHAGPHWARQRDPIWWWRNWLEW